MVVDLIRFGSFVFCNCGMIEEDLYKVADCW